MSKIGNQPIFLSLNIEQPQNQSSLFSSQQLYAPVSNLNYQANLNSQSSQNQSDNVSDLFSMIGSVAGAMQYMTPHSAAYSAGAQLLSGLAQSYMDQQSGQNSLDNYDDGGDCYNDDNYASSSNNPISNFLNSYSNGNQSQQSNPISQLYQALNNLQKSDSHNFHQQDQTQSDHFNNINQTISGLQTGLQNGSIPLCQIGATNSLIAELTKEASALTTEQNQHRNHHHEKSLSQTLTAAITIFRG